MRVVVTGVPGVGKTTVMDNAAKLANIRIMNFGTVMFENAKKDGLIENRDEIRNLPLNVNRRLQEQAAEEISKAGDVIVDTHCSIKTPNGYWVGLPYHVLVKLQPDVIVLIEVEPEEIMKRRNSDPSRQRDKDTVEDIAEHQMMNRAAAMAYAMVCGGCVKIVRNEPGQADKAAEQIASIFRKK
ncbi:MAG: adenylate kinase [Thermoplasmata archaeon]